MDRKRSKTTKNAYFCSEQQEDLQEFTKNLESDLGALYHSLDRVISRRQSLENSVENLTKMCRMQEQTNGIEKRGS